MKYVMRLRARPDELTIVEKHERLVSELAKLNGAFGLRSSDFPTPDCGQELSARFELGKQLARGIKGFVSYRFRGGLEDQGDHDDLLDLEFDPRKIDYGLLLSEVFPCYVRAFQPYFGFIGDEEFTYVDFDRSRNTNSRYELIRFYPTAYYNNWFCANALRLSAEELMRRVADLAVRSEIFGDGVLIVGTDSPIELNRAEEFNNAMRKRLSMDTLHS